MKKKFSALFLFSVVAIALVWMLASKYNYLTARTKVARTLNRLSPNDRALLRDFFYWLCILDDGGGYTLFGSKPMAISSIYRGIGSIFYPSNQATLGKRAMRGFEVWEKHKHLFPSKRFFLKKLPRGDFLDDFVILNKQATLRAIKENFDLFSLEIGAKETTH